MKINIKKSRILSHIWWGAVAACTIPVIIVDIHPFAKMSFLSLLLAYGIWRHSHFENGGIRFAVTALQLGKERQCQLISNPHEYTAELVSHWCIGNWYFLVLGKLPHRGSQKLILPPDVMTESERRYLRRWLSFYEG